METERFLLEDWLRQNGYIGTTTGGEPGTPAVDNGTFEQFMAGKTAQERFPEWTNPDPAISGGFSLSEDGKYVNVPTSKLASNMDESGFLGFEWGDMMGGLSLLSIPLFATMGAQMFGEGGFSGWLSETTNSWVDGVKSFFGGAPDASWSVNAAEQASTVAGSVADAGGIATNAAQALEPSMSNLADAYGNFDMGSGISGNVASASAPTSASSSGGGLIDRVLDWGKKNQALVSGGMQVIGGALKGMGDRDAAMAIADKKIAGDSALLSQKTAEQIKLDEAKKAAIQSGSYFDAKVPMAPGGKVLMRPDGTPVYKGLINAQMGA